MNTEIQEHKKLNDLSLHEILEVTTPPYFRVMKVFSGWLYNFYDASKDEYQPNWTFVPHN